MDDLKNIKLPYIEEFILDLINNNYSQRTVLNYKRDLIIFDSFLVKSGLQLNKISKLDISKYKDFLRTGEYLKTLRELRPGILENSVKQLESSDSKKSSSNASKRYSMYNGRLSSRSVNRILSTLRTYFRFLDDADYKIPITANAIKLVKTERKVSQVAELDELISLIEAPETFEKDTRVKYRNRAMLELLFSTGMRISELINLNIADLKIDRESLTIKDSKIFITGKGKKQRFVYLTPRAQQYLERFLKLRKDDYPALFIPYRGLRSGTKDPYIVRVAANYLQAKIKQYRLILGINLPTSAHSLRHGFATYLAENGANPAAIQHLLGHESLQTTSRYVHSSDRFAEKSHKEHHPLKQNM